MLAFHQPHTQRARRSKRRRGREKRLPLFDFLQVSSLFHADALKVGREERRGVGGGAEKKNVVFQDLQGLWGENSD